MPATSVIVPGEVRHILEDDVARLVMVENVKDIVEEIPPFRAREALLLTCFRERLAG